MLHVHDSQKVQLEDEEDEEAVDLMRTESPAELCVPNHATYRFTLLLVPYYL